MDRIDTRVSQVNLVGLPRVYLGRLLSSPIGPMWVAATDSGILASDWDSSEQDFCHLVQRRLPSQVIYDARRTFYIVEQLSAYLSGKLRQFSLPIDFIGMHAFQVNVLRCTLDIPYGQTMTYKEIAIKVGKLGAARAVGRAEATNPIPIVIPCHRVVGSDGSLHGYGGPGGIKLKSWLLELERANS